MRAALGTVGPLEGTTSRWHSPRASSAWQPGCVPHSPLLLRLPLPPLLLLHHSPAPVPLQSVPQQFQGAGVQERVRCYCVAEAFDRYALQASGRPRPGRLPGESAPAVRPFLLRIPGTLEC